VSFRWLCFSVFLSVSLIRVYFSVVPFINLRICLIGPKTSSSLRNTLIPSSNCARFQLHLFITLHVIISNHSPRTCIAYNSPQPVTMHWFKADQLCSSEFLFFSSRVQVADLISTKSESHPNITCVPQMWLNIVFNATTGPFFYFIFSTPLSSRVLSHIT
jgi:hypothetical protein